MANEPNLLCNSFGWLLLSCLSAFASVASTKNEGVAGNLINFLLDPFCLRAVDFVSFSTKREQENVHLAGALPDFGLITS